MRTFATVDNTIHSSPDNDDNWKIERNKSSQCTRLIGAGRKSCFPEATLASLKQFLDEKRSNEYAFSAQILMAEVRSVDPVSCYALKPDLFRNRIHCLMRSWDISWRGATHKAQKTRLCDRMIADFQLMVKEKI
jgi:hypothetical protein